MGVSSLWSAPVVNPINKKARTIPALNPFNQYGRVFFFSWFGFFVAFWSWYAFPPLLSDEIKPDLKLSTNEVNNSNVIALTATLLVRVVAGTACDRFGPRLTFAACLLLGAIPTFLAGTIHNAAGLYTIRFFVGILGGSFVPCQVWTTGFYDKNVIGTANSLTAGLGNAGGGITYFIMPAVYKSLVKSRHLTPHVAWRVAFVVPGIVITFTALALILLCPDTPTGKWSQRHQAAENNLRVHNVEGKVVDVPSEASDETRPSSTEADVENETKMEKRQDPSFGHNEAQLGEQEMLETAQCEVIQKPSWSEAMQVVFSLPTLTLAATYFSTFGTELSVNSILGTYYKSKLHLSTTDSGNYAAIFGILNAVCRPLGGVVSDQLYKRTGTLWSKKALMHTYAVLTGVFMIAIGASGSHQKSTVIGLISGGVAFFLEGANGAVFSLVPHVHSYANGIVSGITGASGNFGGIIFAIIFRYNGTDYAKTFWIIGVIIIGLQLAVCWISPVPKKTFIK